MRCSGQRCQVATSVACYDSSKNMHAYTSVVSRVDKPKDSSQASQQHPKVTGRLAGTWGNLIKERKRQKNYPRQNNTRSFQCFTQMNHKKTCSKEQLAHEISPLMYYSTPKTQNVSIIPGTKQTQRPD